MREFALLAPSSALSSPEAGTITRFVVGALLLSHSVRKDVVVVLIIDGGERIAFQGSSMRNVRPDEQSLLGIIRAGLRRLETAGAGRIMQGINVSRGSLEDYIGEAKGAKIFYGGTGGKSKATGQDFSMVLQYPELKAEVRELLLKSGFSPVRLSRCQIPLDQAAVVLNNMLDRQQIASP